MKLAAKVPQVFEPLWRSKSRYIGIYGGRGSGKSWAVAQFLIVQMITRPGLRIACVRETQNSIKDSVHQLLSDTIVRLEVSDLFTILETEIRGPSGGTIVFKGLRDTSTEAVKSMEGFDYFWWEEAQGASQRSIDVLRPTLRKSGSQLLWTWNPRKRSDAVDLLLRQSGLSSDMVTLVKANWSDNPYFGPELDQERRADLLGDQERYAHIWEGAFEAEADTQLIPSSLVQQAMARHAVSHIHDPMILGVDVARFGDDKSIIYPRRGFDAVTMPYETYEKMDTMQLASRVIEASNRYKADAIFVDEGGIGGGVIDRLRQLNVDCIGINFGGTADRYIQGHPNCSNKRSEIWLSMREAMKDGLCLPNIDTLDTDLTGPLYSYDAQNRIVLERKADMKKRGVKSPDIGDALALTWAYPVEAKALIRAEEQRKDADYDPIWR